MSRSTWLGAERAIESLRCRIPRTVALSPRAAHQESVAGITTTRPPASQPRNIRSAVSGRSGVRCAASTS